jgi:hypothetical protein
VTPRKFTRHIISEVAAQTMVDPPVLKVSWTLPLYSTPIRPTVAVLLAGEPFALSNAVTHNSTFAVRTV